MIRKAAAAIGAALVGLGAAPALGEPRVAVDIAPAHSVVARVMAGIGSPDLLLPVGASPHGYALRPSAAAMLDAAEVVFWMGPDLAPWIADPLQALAADARIVSFEDAPGVTRLAVRPDGPQAASPPSGEDQAKDTNAYADGHLWLDPRNAVAFAATAADALSAEDPANAAAYRANAAAFAAEMAALEAEIAAEIAPLRDRPFVVFHDAYQYFETRFAIPAAASLALQEGVAPSAARVAEIRDRIAAEGVVCAFAEPQFEPALLNTVTGRADVRTAVLDPMGGDLAPGPEFYPALIRQLAANLAACLGR